MEKLKTRGERFFEARTIYNKHGEQSMRQVNRVTGISDSLICDLEDDNKVRGVSYVVIVTLAKHYGVSADWLLGLSNAPTTNPELRAVCDYTGLSEGVVRALHNSQEFKLKGSLDEIINWFSVHMLGVRG